MSGRSEVADWSAAATDADRAFRKARRLAVACGVMLAIGFGGMVLASLLEPSWRRWPGSVSVGLALAGSCGGLVFAMRAYAAWGLRRIYEAGVSGPDTPAVVLEHRLAGRLAVVSCVAAVVGILLMFFADEHRWLAAPTVILFLGGCGGGVHFLQVRGVTQQLMQCGNGTQ